MFLLGLLLSSRPSDAQVLIGVEPSVGKVSQLTAEHDEIWVVAENGIFRMDRKGDTVQRVTAVTGRIFKIDDEIWLGTSEGTFWTNPQSKTVQRVAGITAGINSIEAIGGETWATANPDGVFRIDRKRHDAQRVTGIPAKDFRLQKVGDEIWVDGREGVFRIDRRTLQAQRIAGVLSTNLLNQGVIGITKAKMIEKDVWIATFDGALRVPRNSIVAQRIVGLSGPINEIIAVEDEVWLAAYKGLFRVAAKSDKAQLVKGVNPPPVPVKLDFGFTTRQIDLGEPINPPVYTLLRIGEEIWVGAQNGVFRMKADQSKEPRLVSATSPYAGPVKVESWGSNIWLRGPSATFRVDPNSNVSQLMVSGQVDDLGKIGDNLWLLTHRGIFRIDSKENTVQHIDGIPQSVVNSIVSVSDQVWIATPNGVFRVNQQTGVAHLIAGTIGKVSEIVPLGGDEVWLATEDGPLSVDAHTSIEIALANSLRTFWGPIWLEGRTRPLIRYLDVHSKQLRINTSRAEPIQVVDGSDPADVESKKQNARWRNLKDASITLTPGRHDIYLAVKDRWGNQQSQHFNIWVLPTWTALSVAIPVCTFSVSLLCLAFAPYPRFRYCHMLLMNPFLRNWFSFGVIPLLLTTVPAIRTHIFGRYRRRLRDDPTFNTIAARYVIPDSRFDTIHFNQELISHRVVGLCGESGIGKSAFLMFLAHHTAVRSSLVPIFVDLSVDADNPEESVRRQLQKYGDLTDEAIVRLFVDHGGFLFIFDGLNEVSEHLQQHIIRFADSHRLRSCVCLSSQVVSTELRRVATIIDLEPLSKPKISELIRTTVAASDALLSALTGEAYDICRVPLQLELLVEMWHATGTVPVTVDSVYSYVLAPILDRDAWSRKGHGDYPDVVGQLAFRMLVEKRPCDLDKDYLPQELRAQLISKKLLLDRGGVLEFRHDRVRAYLASTYFSRRWQALLGDRSMSVDSNWETMLQFHFAHVTTSADARELLFLLLTRDFETAKRLFAWLKIKAPELCGEWERDFYLKVGEKVLTRA